MSESITPEQAKILLFREMANRSFLDFCNLICPLEPLGGSTQIPKHCCDWVEFMENNEHVCILGPREHMKTVTFERYMLWSIARNPNIRIILVSDTAALATTILRFPRSNIEENARFRTIYGDMVDDKKWGADEFIVKRSMKHDRNSTLYAIGVFGAVVGRRADLIILDDPIDVRKQTPGVRQKIQEWIFTELMGTLSPEGRMIFIGSRKGPNDLYSYIEKSRTWINMMVSKAILNEEEKQTLWPEYWSWDRLMKRKQELGPTSFYLNFMNEVRSTENALLTEESVDKSLKKDEGHYLEHKRDDEGQYVMGIDWSVSENAIEAEQNDLDYLCITVLRRIGEKLDPTSDRAKVAHLFRARGMTPDQQLAKVVEIAEKFSPMLIYSEATAFQRIYTTTLRQKTNLPVRPFNMNATTKWSASEGLPALRIYFETGKMIIPWSFQGQDKIDPLVENLMLECKTFSPEMPAGYHDDAFISLFLAQRALLDAPLFYRKVFIGSL